MKKEDMSLNQFLDSSKNIDMSKYPHIKRREIDPHLSAIRAMFPDANIQTIELDRDELDMMNPRDRYSRIIHSLHVLDIIDRFLDSLD